MLKFTAFDDGAPVWVNPHQVSAVLASNQSTGGGCVLLLAGGFEIRLREDVADVTTQVQKRLDAY